MNPNEEIVVTDKIPIPKDFDKNARRSSRGSLRQQVICGLKVGESFFIRTTIYAVCSLRWWVTSRYPERRYTARKEKGGVRVWRCQ